MNSIFAVYKPKGPTSFDIVAQIRKITGIKKVGHAGTLDPLAEGVLIIGVGREATKRLSEVVDKEKEYIADIRLGMTSETDDEEKVHKVHKVHKVIKSDEIKNIIFKFIGVIDQIPPKYSAMKVGGKRAYKLARAGKEVKMESRQVEIKEIEILEYEYPDLKLRVVTGPGVYIRALARDIGEALGTGAYLAGLVRTRVGGFSKNDCISLNSINNKSKISNSK
ncbi:MAG: tRNA pseudouridine(55) synthase TruB [Patescibacteria group bacterium]